MAAIQRFPRSQSVALFSGVSRKGFELSNIIKPDDAERFHCNICKFFARDPVELKHCGHIFCGDCISDFCNKPSSLNCGKFKCPVNDGGEFTALDRVPLEDSSKCAYGLYSEIDLKCANECGAVLSAGSMTEHENWECQKRVVECAHLGCHVHLPNSEMGSHIESCEHRLIFCSLCGLPRKFLGRHTCVTEMRKTMERMLY